MFLIPIGQKDASLRRVPYIGLALLALNVVVHLLLINPVQDGYVAMEVEAQAIVTHLRENPGLELEPTTDSPMLNAAAPRLNALARAGRPLDGTNDPVPMEAAYVELDALVADFIAVQDAHPYYAFALIPAAPKPVSFITHMFMHGGWLHLLGNCLFLYILGLLLESTYGHTLFATVYLVTGLLAALTHILSAPGSTIPMLGASGAISGVMGAFLVRLPMAKISVLWNIFFIYWGTLVMRGWLLLGIWIAFQISAATGEDAATGGVAVWAHIGGFAAGVVFGLLIKVLRLEPVELTATGVVALDGRAFRAYDNALHHLHVGNLDAALNEAQAAQALEPGHIDIMRLLFRIHGAQVDREAAGRSGLRLLRALMEQGDAAGAAEHWHHWKNVTKGAGPPVLAGLRFRLANLVRPQDPALSRTLLAALAKDGRAGAIQEKALALLDEAPSSVPLAEVSAPRQVVGLPGNVVIGASTDAPGARPSPPTGLTVKAWHSALTALDTTLHLSDGRQLAYLEILGVAVGWVGHGDTMTGSPPAELVMDLVTQWPRGPDSALGEVVRIVGGGMDPRALLQMPEVAPMAAFSRLVETLVQRSGGQCAVHVEADGSGIPAFATMAAFESHFYGIGTDAWLDVDEDELK